MTGRDLLESGSARPRSRPVPRGLAGADGHAYLVVTRMLPAGEPGVVQVWRSGPAWTRLVDYSRSIGSTPRFTTAVGEPNGGILMADGAAGGQLLLRHDHQAGWTVVPLPA